MPGTVIEVTSSHVHIKSQKGTKKILKRDVKVPAVSTVNEVDIDEENDATVMEPTNFKRRRPARSVDRDSTPDHITERNQYLLDVETTLEEARVGPSVGEHFNFYCKDRLAKSPKEFSCAVESDVADAGLTSSPLTEVEICSPVRQGSRKNKAVYIVRPTKTVKSTESDQAEVLSTVRFLPDGKPLDIRLTRSHMKSILTSGSPIATSVIEAYLCIAEKANTHRSEFTGFENPSSIG